MGGVANHTGAPTRSSFTVTANQGTGPRVVVAPAIDTFFSKFKPFVFPASTIAPAFETPSHLAPPV